MKLGLPLQRYYNFLLTEQLLQECVFLYYDLLAKTFTQKLVDKHFSY